MRSYLPSEDNRAEANDNAFADCTQIRTQTPDFAGHEEAPTGTDKESEISPQASKNHELGRKLTRSDATMHNRVLAASLGFEPRQNDSESFVLPLHHEAKSGTQNLVRRLGL